ncbi:MAG: alpha/beta hydrolase family protein [Candidatus Levyibacteriota bacterium]
MFFLHGWKSKRKRSSRYAQIISKRGYICLTYDMRSHGESDGDRSLLSRQDYLNDAIAAYDFLKNQPGVDPEQICVVGSSFGSYLATLLSAERNVAALVLRAPSNYPDEGFTLPQPRYASGKSTEWRKKKLSYRQAKALYALHNFAGKVYIIQSEHDELVPPQTIDNYIDAIADKAKLTKNVMLGADHSIQKDSDQNTYIQLLLDWFSNKV